MKPYHLALLACLMSCYFGCTKHNDVIKSLPVTNAVAAPNDSSKIVARSFSVFSICGKYLVSGTDDLNRYNHDTIIITQCGDSSVYYTSYNPNIFLLGHDICSKYPALDTNVISHASKNYLFWGRQTDTQTNIFFNPNYPDSITISALYDHCGDNTDVLSLTGIKIR